MCQDGSACTCAGAFTAARWGRLSSPRTVQAVARTRRNEKKPPTGGRNHTSNIWGRGLGYTSARLTHPPRISALLVWSGLFTSLSIHLGSVPCISYIKLTAWWARAWVPDLLCLCRLRPELRRPHHTNSCCTPAMPLHVRSRRCTTQHKKGVCIGRTTDSVLVTPRNHVCPTTSCARPGTCRKRIDHRAIIVLYSGWLI